MARITGSNGTLSIGGKVIANVTNIRFEPMGFNGKPPKNNQRPPLPPPPPPMGHLPPPPPARRAVAQSSRATAANVAAAERMLTGNGANQPAGIVSVQISEQALRLSQTTGISFSDAMDGLMRAAQAGWLESTQTASAKPAKQQPPSTDLTKRPKRKITLE